MRKFVVVMAAVAVVLAATQVWASDFQPPNWRGIPGSQTVQWEFLTDPGSYGGGSLFFVPDCSTQHGWTPAFQPTLLHTPGPGAGWSAVQPTSLYAGASGVYNPAGPEGDGWINLSGSVLIHLPDVQIANPTKEIWLQLTWEPQSGADIPSVWYGAGNLTPAANPPFLPFQAGPLVDTVVWGAGGPGPVDPAYPFRAVHQTIYHFDLTPNPNDETIYIRGGINVDEIVIDTRCGQVPEPATMTLFATGVLGLFGAIRRKLSR